MRIQDVGVRGGLSSPTWGWGVSFHPPGVGGVPSTHLAGGIARGDKDGIQGHGAGEEDWGQLRDSGNVRFSPPHKQEHHPCRLSHTPQLSTHLPTDFLPILPLHSFCYSSSKIILQFLCYILSPITRLHSFSNSFTTLFITFLSWILSPHPVTFLLLFPCYVLLLLLFPLLPSSFCLGTLFIVSSVTFFLLHVLLRCSFFLILGYILSPFPPLHSLSYSPATFLSLLLCYILSPCSRFIPSHIPLPHFFLITSILFFLFHAFFRLNILPTCSSYSSSFSLLVQPGWSSVTFVALLSVFPLGRSYMTLHAFLSFLSPSLSCI
jgi:hypothetical protein